MTERKRTEAELRRQREALYQTEKLTTMGTVLAGVAHELNNPLTAVTGYAKLLRQDLAGTPSATRAENIAHAADRCASIVRNFPGAGAEVSARAPAGAAQRHRARRRRAARLTPCAVDGIRGEARSGGRPAGPVGRIRTSSTRSWSI
jgi:C4-dicarboxylate-specific signal transduction histidine kinase